MDNVSKAFVPNFLYDIFISYPRESNERDTLEIEWVNEFQRLLTTEISQRLRDSARIYFDKESFKGGDHSDELLAAARNSALFLPIVSPRYVAPHKFTMKELKAFCEAGAVEKRIVTIELIPVKTEDGRPIELQGPKRNEFFRNEQGRPIKLTPKSKKDGDDYSERLQIVAEDIKDLLLEMRRKADGEVQGSNEDEKKPLWGATVLLAEKEEQVSDEREMVRAYLKSYGATVLPEGEYGDDEARFMGAFSAHLKRADLFVQLLSPIDEANHWAERQGEPSRAKLQANAANNDTRKIPVLQWRKPIPIKREALKFWDEDLLDGSHVVTGTLEEFKKTIKDTIKETLKAVDEELSKPLKNKYTPQYKLLFFAVDQEDKNFADMLIRAFEGNEDWEAKRSSFEGSSGNVRKLLEQNLIACTAFCVIYGKSQSWWVDKQLQNYKKVEARRKEPLPLGRRAILLAPPAGARDIIWSLKRIDFQKLEAQASISAERIQQLITELHP
jgi:hypothetical protein